MSARRSHGQGGGPSGTRGLRGLGEWCARHLVIVIVGRLVVLAAPRVIDRSFGGDCSDSFSPSGVILCPGPAVSVPVDATAVRLLRVPAVTTLPASRARWAPSRLDRVLPHIDAEGDTEERPAPTRWGPAARSASFRQDMTSSRM
ncbi:hypothetical protein [Streptomyces heilongjiangensis]|uniref:Uncharacterized protein n=1 Tax=Streptomyces heilongjiangensis TaxID=945052 RepID=A0ABW1AZ96_9ACTN|nr:hypothetical protein [Streptomyces heilongjiangensis]MDC2947988.1 hypothetical protein [Streptomyces heilongjiangensis]